MSWIIGHLGPAPSHGQQRRLAAVHGPPLHVSRQGGGYIATGGLPETCLYGELPGREAAVWFVAGLGLQRCDDHYEVLDAAAWQARLDPSKPALHDLDGHFVALRWQPDAQRLEVFTDAAGLRSIHFAETPEGITFSTRLDWLTALCQDASIDYETFGAHWLTFNQLSTDSLVHGFRRLGPGGHAVVTPTVLRLRHRPWTPAPGEAGDGTQRFEATLKALVCPRLPDGQSLSLGLSGGLDSRLLLALRLQAGPARTHVFGDPEHPDARIARRIARDTGIEQTHLHAEVPDAATCLALLRAHVAYSPMISPASAILGLRHYPALHAHQHAMIDGGFGEIGRRQFLNRLYYRGRAALRSGDPAALLPYLHVPRADVFTGEALATMQRGALHQLDATWHALATLDTRSLADRLDVFAIRTRLPNFYGPEQARLDTFLLNYMPYAQSSLLHALFQVPRAQRRGGRLYRALIRRYAPSLARYPLVKGSITYPFGLTTLPAYAYTKLKTRFTTPYTDPTRHRFLQTIKPFVLEAVHDPAVRACPAYDPRKLAALVEGYFSGQDHLAPAVDWWAAFEMWRRVVQSEGL